MKTPKSLAHELCAARKEAHWKLEQVEVLINEALKHLRGDSVNEADHHASKTLLTIAQQLTGEFVTGARLAIESANEILEAMSPEVKA